MLCIYVVEVFCKETWIIQFESMFATAYIFVHTKGHPFEVVAKSTVGSFDGQVCIDHADS